MPVRAIHLTDAQQLAKEKPVDIAFVCMKSYDTAWATMMIPQYLAPDGYVVSLQNCMNEETIAGVVGWGKTLGCIASSHHGRPAGARPRPSRRRQGRGGAHGLPRRRGARPHHAARRGSLPPGRLFRQRQGDRQPVGRALVEAGRQRHGQRPLGLHRAARRRRSLQNDALRRFSARLGSEAIRVGQALGYQLEEILHLPPETIARAGEGDDGGDARLRRAAPQGRQAHVVATQRPSMGQDMQKGRRTEIEFLNGFVVREGEKIGMPCRANAALTDIVKRVERGELQPDPRHITELRLN